jgi:hypothetical protein
MPLLILDNSHSKNPVMFFGRWCWERVAAKDSPSHAVTWRARTGDQKPVRHRGLADFLEHIFRNPDEVTTIDDVPKLNDDDMAAAEWINSHVAKLDAVIVRSIATRKDAKIQIGRALRQEKKILGHGQFERHVSEVLSSMISLRTAERYMKLAKEQDAEANTDKLALLNSGSDDGAKDVKTTTERARADVKSKVSKDKPQTTTVVYELPLLLSSDEGKAVDALRESGIWPDVETNIILVLRQFCTTYGFEFGTE